MEYTFRIKRYDPDVDIKPHFEEYVVDLEPNDRVLDGLNRIKWDQDGTVTYRRSCAHGVCGSDAMRINGRNYLACKTLMKEFGKKITIEPMIGFKVIKDMVVDMDPFFDGYKSIKPYLIASDPPRRRRAAADPRAGRPLRGRHQVHPLRRLHDLMPDHLDERELCRSGGHRQCRPLHLRQPRRRRARPPAHPQHAVGRLALPHRLQLHRSLPARH